MGESLRESLNRVEGDTIRKILQNRNGITLIALIITLIVPYDKMKECCNM